MEERLQKILAMAGYGSRRANEVLISAGRVTVNGKTVILGTKADRASDDIRVDGQQISQVAQEKIYIALNKPKNVLSDVDPKDERRTVRDFVPVPGHLFTVGRLDFDSEGLILLTNDGDLANKLTHPRYGHEKEYRVQVLGRPDEKQLAIWRRGVVMKDGTRTQPATVIVDAPLGKSTRLTIVMREGKKRQIREVGSLLGLPVERILRVRIGTLELDDLKPGEWRNLKLAEIKSLIATTKKKQNTAKKYK